MKNIIMFIILFLFSIINVYAYTKDDVINLIDNIKTCDSTTTNLIKNLKVTYKKMLDSRDLSEGALNKLYSNLNGLINEIKKNDICKISDAGNLSLGEINEIYNDYKEINDIIVKAPSTDGSSNNDELESVIKFDSVNNVVEITDSIGSLNVAVKLDNKLNYVGLNRSIIFVMVGLSICIIVLFFVKRNPLKDSLLMLLIPCLIIVFTCRNYISTLISGVNSLIVNDSYNYKDAVVKDKNVIANPSYKAKYAKISYGNSSSDIYYGDSKDLLIKGIGQDVNSELPGFGKVILSGHNTLFFKNLFSVSNDSVFTIETNYGTYKYKYVDGDIVNDNDTSILDKDYDLIMYTCYPDDAVYGNKRLVIMAKLVEEVWE